MIAGHTSLRPTRLRGGPQQGKACAPHPLACCRAGSLYIPPVLRKYGEDKAGGGGARSWVSKSCKAPSRCRQGRGCSRRAKPGLFGNLATYLCTLLPQEMSPFVPYKQLVTAGLIRIPGPSRTRCTLLLGPPLAYGRKPQAPLK